MPIPRFHLQFEWGDVCDADCPMCCIRAAAGGFRDRAGRGFMPERTLASLIAAFADFPALTREVTTPWAGEAPLHPAFDRQFPRLLAAGGRVNLVTNALRLTPERAALLVEAAAGRPEPFNILVSLDAATAATYRLVKGVDAFATARAHVISLLAARDRAGARWPSLLLQFVLQEENAADLDRFRAFAASLFDGRPHYLALEGRGIDTSRDGVNLRTIGFLGRSATRDRASLAGRIGELAREAGAAPALSPEARPPRGAPGDAPCAHPFENLNVHWTGAATVCCNDLDLAMAVGAFPETSLTGLFGAPRMRRLRALHGAGRRRILTLCRDCVVHRPKAAR